MNQVSELTAAPLGDLAKKLSYITVCDLVETFHCCTSLLLKDVIFTRLLTL